MDKSSFYGVKNRASTNLKVNLHLYISLRKIYTYKTGVFVYGEIKLQQSFYFYFRVLIPKQTLLSRKCLKLWA
jgi:hypothetical protein